MLLQTPQPAFPTCTAPLPRQLRNVGAFCLARLILASRSPFPDGGSQRLAAGADTRTIHQGLLALAWRSSARGMLFPFPDVPLVGFPGRERGPGRGARRCPGKDAADLALSRRTKTTPLYRGNTTALSCGATRASAAGEGSPPRLQELRSQRRAAADREELPAGPRCAAGAGRRGRDCVTAAGSPEGPAWGRRPVSPEAPCVPSRQTGRSGRTDGVPHTGQP